MVIRYGGNSTAELIQALQEVDVALLQGHGFDRAAFAHMGMHGPLQGARFFWPRLRPSRSRRCDE